jgi:hypothetical protein
MLTADVGADSKFTTRSLWLGVELSWWSFATRRSRTQRPAATTRREVATGQAQESWS